MSCDHDFKGRLEDKYLMAHIDAIKCEKCGVTFSPIIDDNTQQIYLLRKDASI